ncbi:MAG: sulfite exporter TauE/SafE family protein [Proteobacteria bacterium]|nr:sulfite exporter TauE/SafE family protein [Pseudomonadota bacterium]
MTLEPQYILYFLLLGTIVGFMAGLLGIGGGGIMVPVLTGLFLAMGMPVEKVLHLALGSSMAAIIVTSIASLRAHHLRDGVLWDYVKNMSTGIVVGTFVATYFASLASSLFLAVFFSVFMGIVALQMFWDKKPVVHTKKAGAKHLFFVGSGIGAISALVSIGGGSMTVPYLLWRNVDIKKAIGTSAAIGLPISLSGTLGYVINGWSDTSCPMCQDNSMLGFVYLPAVVLISVTSFLFAPLGVKMAHVLPLPVLKKVFALLLIVLSVKMLISIN